jgi:hypothetical protein
MVGEENLQEIWADFEEEIQGLREEFLDDLNKLWFDI